MVLLAIVAVPLLYIPPPLTLAVLPLRVLLLKFRVLPAPTAIPPPLPLMLPLAIVILSIFTVTPAPEILNTCTALLPLTVRLLAPGPLIVTESVMGSTPLALVSRIVPATPVRSMISVPAVLLAARIASRKLIPVAPGVAFRVVMLVVSPSTRSSVVVTITVAIFACP